jgi:hypothetical protein
MLKRRVAKLEKKIAPLADAPRVVLICNHLGQPSFAMFVGGAQLSREAGESKAAFLERVRAC